MAAKFEVRRHALGPYLCIGCDGWHVGRKKGD